MHLETSPLVPVLRTDSGKDDSQATVCGATGYRRSLKCLCTRPILNYKGNPVNFSGEGGQTPLPWGPASLLPRAQLRTTDHHPLALRPLQLETGRSCHRVLVLEVCGPAPPGGGTHPCRGVTARLLSCRLQQGAAEAPDVPGGGAHPQVHALPTLSPALLIHGFLTGTGHRTGRPREVDSDWGRGGGGGSASLSRAEPGILDPWGTSWALGGERLQTRRAGQGRRRTFS